MEYHINCAARMRACNAAGMKYEEMREEMQENTRRMKAQAEEYMEILQAEKAEGEARAAAKEVGEARDEACEAGVEAGEAGGEATSTGTGASSSGANDGTDTVGPKAKDTAAAHEAKDKSTGSQPPAKRRRYDDVPDTD